MSKKEQKYITLAELSEALGVDKSNARKFVLQKGFDFKMLRGGEEARGQFVAVLAKKDADKLIKIRKAESL